jgi:hypothetical protein
MKLLAEELSSNLFWINILIGILDQHIDWSAARAHHSSDGAGYRRSMPRLSPAAPSSVRRTMAKAFKRRSRSRRCGSAMRRTLRPCRNEGPWCRESQARSSSEVFIRLEAKLKFRLAAAKHLMRRLNRSLTFSKQRRRAIHGRRESSNSTKRPSGPALFDPGMQNEQARGETQKDCHLWAL